MFKLIKNKTFQNLFIFDLIYQLIFIVILLPFGKEIFNFIMRLSEFGFFSIENTSNLKSPTKIITIFIIIIFISVIKLFEISSFIFAINQIRLNRTVSVFEIFNNSYKQIKVKIKSFQNYIILFLMIINIPNSINIIKKIKLPNFVLEYVLNSNAGIKIFFILKAISFIVAIFTLFSYNIFFLENKKFFTCISLSFKKSKKYLFKTFKVLATIEFKIFVIKFIKLIFLFLILSLFFINPNRNELNKFQIITYICITITMKILTNVVSNYITFFSISKLYFKISENSEISNTIYPSNKIKLKLSVIFIFLIVCGLISKYNKFSDEIKFYHAFRNKNPDIIAHRGSTKNSAENTLESVNEAISNEAEFAEIDVVLTKDDVVVLCHDHNLKRLTGKNVLIENLTFEELKNYKIIDKKYSKSFNFIDLETVIKETSGKIKLNIELKPFKNNEKILAKEVVKLVKNKNHDIIISSLSAKILKYVKILDPNISTGLILAFGYGNFYNVNFVDFFCIEKEIATNDIIRKIRAKGKKIYIWTTNNYDDIKNAYLNCVDGIITDQVSLSKEILNYEKDNIDFNYIIINKLILLID